MRYPSLSPGRTGGGSDDDETDSNSGSGLGGSIPGAPDDGGSSDPSTGDPDPVDGGTAGGGRGPGFDDDPAPDPPDPDPPDDDPPNQFRDELGGDPFDSGGRNTGGGTRPDPAPDPDPDPSPTSRGSTDVDVPDGASDGGGIGERITANLDSLSQAYTDTVAEPAGDLAAAANPIAGIEEQQLGTNRVGTVTENAVETVAQFGNVPGAVAGSIDTGQALAEASARSRDQVTIGGVPTGVSVPNRTGQRQNAQAAANIATSSAAQAAENPFETTGQVIGGVAGGVAGGAALTRGVRGASRVADTDGGGSGGSVPSGRSNVGTDGVDSLLDDVDVDARRGTSGPSARSRIEGEVSRAVDDVTERVQNSPVGDFVDDTRAQLQQQRPSSRDTGSAPDRTRPADAGGSFEDVRQDSLTQTQDQLRSDATRPNPGTFEGAPSPFRSGGGDTIGVDGGVSLQRGSGVVDDAAGAGASSGGGSGGGFGAGLGSLSGVNDPTGVSETASPTGGTSLDPQRILGAGTGSTGTETLDERNDPTGIDPGTLDGFGEQRIGGGTLPGDATGGGADTGTLDETNDPTNVAPPGSRTETGGETDTFSPTDTGSDTGSEPGTDTPTDTATTTADLLATTTLTGTQSRTDAAGTGASLPDSPTLGAPVTSTDAIVRLGGGGGGDGGAPPRPRGEEEPDQDDDAPPLLGFASDSREFGSGIASASDFLDGDGARDPFSL